MYLHDLERKIDFINYIILSSLNLLAMVKVSNCRIRNYILPKLETYDELDPEELELIYTKLNIPVTEAVKERYFSNLLSKFKEI